MVRGLPLALVQGGALLTQPTLREALAPQTDDGCSLLRQFLGLVPRQTRHGAIRQEDRQTGYRTRVWEALLYTPLAEILTNLGKGSSPRDATAQVHHPPNPPRPMRGSGPADKPHAH